MQSVHEPASVVIRRVKSEFREMPGLRLTLAQAQRLWSLDRATCEALLETLVRERFLSRSRDGAFQRADLGLDQASFRGSRPA